MLMMVRTILLIVITLPAWALPEARLLDQSASGKTVVFNLGSHDGINHGDYAVVIKEVRSLNSRDLRLIPAAKARAVKLYTNSSIWILYKIYDQELLIKGERFLVLSESNMLKGRKLPNLARVTVVVDERKIIEQSKDAEADDRERLGKLTDNYEVLAPTHATHAATDSDFDLVDLEAWKKSKDSRYHSSIYKSANKEEFTRQLRLATFEKLVTAYLLRVNDPDFNYEIFYEKQRKSIYANEIMEHAVYESEYNRFLRQESYKSSADAKLFRSILEKGDSWSADYSDEELRKVLNHVSMLQEKDRRTLVRIKATRYGIHLDYGFHLNDTQTNDDPLLYKRASRYSTELDFEAIPFLKHDALERFTLNATFRLNYTAFQADDYNADLNEHSISFGTNWYPLYVPYAVESPILYLGTFFRTGFANANAPTANEKANYTVMSLPGFRAGFKYLTQHRIGIRLQASMETLKIERYEANRFTSVLPERANLVESKLGFALTYAF